MLGDVRRPAAEAEADGHRKARPARPNAEVLVPQAGESARAQVEDVVESEPDVDQRALALPRLVRRSAGCHDVVRNPFWEITNLCAPQPPGREPCIGSLRRDDVAEGLPDRPLAASRVSVQELVAQRLQGTVQLPSGARGRSDEPARRRPADGGLIQ